MQVRSPLLETNGVLHILEAIPSQRDMERQQEQKDG
jgi:hypothetical protein